MALSSRVLLLSIVMLVISASNADAKKEFALAQDAPNYQDYVKIQGAIFEDFGGAESCAMEPVENAEISDADNPLYRGACRLPEGRQFCLTDHGSQFCFEGGGDKVQFKSTGVKFDKTITSASATWQAFVFDRCADEPEWIEVLNYKLKKDGDWTITKRSAGIVLDLRHRCGRILKEKQQ